MPNLKENISLEIHASNLVAPCSILPLFSWLLCCTLAMSADVGLINTQKNIVSPLPHYYCTAASEPYYHLLLNLIGSIHKHDFAQTEAIVVYDIGLTPEQRAKLLTIQKVELCNIEQRNPDICKRFHCADKGRDIIGAYSWKPVAIKQMLERHPIFFWIDAGLELAGSMDDLFAYLAEVGCFFHNRAGPFHGSIRRMLTPFVCERFAVTEQELNQTGLESGFMGVTDTIRDCFVIPAYEASDDIRNFLDFGQAGRRHDQAIFSLFAVRSGLTIYHHFSQPLLLTTPSGKKYHFQHCYKAIGPNDRPNTLVRYERNRYTKSGNHHADYIRYKPTDQH